MKQYQLDTQYLFDDKFQNLGEIEKNFLMIFEPTLKVYIVRDYVQIPSQHLNLMNQYLKNYLQRLNDQ